MRGDETFLRNVDHGAYFSTNKTSRWDGKTPYVVYEGNVDRLTYHLFGWKYSDDFDVAIDELVDAPRIVRS